ncbi:MAG: nicotinamide riboside transporter PnuC [Bacteroidales bacterium]
MYQFSELFWSCLEYFGVATGFLYLILEMKQKPAMWLIGGISSLLYVFIFGFSRIYADMGFNIYNVIISAYGFIQWRKSIGSPNGEHVKDHQIEYTRLNLQQFLQIISVTVLIYGIIFIFLKTCTDSPIPQGDAFTTTVSIVATWMLARRIIEHWIFWVVVNIVSVYLYYLRDLYPTMVLYTFYAFAAVTGYYIWKKKGVCYVSKRI